MNQSPCVASFILNVAGLVPCVLAAQASIAAGAASDASNAPVSASRVLR